MGTLLLKPKLWLNIITAGWVFFSAVGGAVVAYFMFDADNVLYAFLIFNVVQTILVTLMINYFFARGHKKDFYRRLLVWLFFLLLLPILLLVFFATGEIPLGVFGLIILPLTTIPQILLVVIYLIFNHFFSYRQKLVAILSVIIQFIFVAALSAAFALFVNK